MRKRWSLTFGVLFFLSLFLFIGVAIANEKVIPMPCLIKANNVTVGGTILTGANADYTIKVTNTAGTEYTPVDTAGSSFGSPIRDRFQYNIPKYDGDQPGGAATGATACIAMYYKTTKLTMSYPAQGSCPAGSGEITVQGDGLTMGFGGLKGMPDDAAHTFINPFTATGPAIIGVIPSSLDFGDVPTGPKDLGITVSNTGNSDLTIGSVTITGDGFTLKATIQPETKIPSRTTQPITVTFTSTGQGAATGNVAIASDDKINPTLIVLMTAKGTTEAVANVSLGGDVLPLGGFVGGIDFGNVDVGSVSAEKTITITNSGGYNLVIGAITPGGNIGQFTKISDACSSQTIAPNGTCNVVGTFNPTATGDTSANLTFATNKGKTGEGKDNPTDTSTVVTFTGKGVQLGFTVLPASLDFGTLTLPDTTTKSLVTVVKNTGTGSLTFSIPTIAGAQFTVLPTASFDLAVDESATLTVTYTAASSATPHTGTLTVTSGGITTTVSLTGKTVTRPAKPIITTTPIDRAPLMPKFTGSGLVSPVGSQWSVRCSGTGEVVYTTSTFDPSGNVIGAWDPSNLTSFTLPKGILQYNSTYTAWVKYINSTTVPLNESLPSDVVTFTTLENPNPNQYDAHGNPFIVNNWVTYTDAGIIKTQQNLNKSTTNFASLSSSAAFKIQVPQISTVSTIVTNGTTGTVPVNTENVTMTKTNGGSGQQALVMMPSVGGGTITSITPIDTTGQSVTDPSSNIKTIVLPGLNISGYSAPYGLYNIIITGAPAFPTAMKIVIVPPSPFAAGTKWYKINPSTWIPVEYTNFVVDASGNGILTLTDNGPGDSDPTVGTIRDPGFPGNAVGGGGGGGGGGYDGGSNSGWCFIATAAYGSYFSPFVKILRDFRDTFLVTNRIGQSFVNWYYRTSPPIADFIAKSEFAKASVRIMLLPAVGFSLLSLKIGMFWSMILVLAMLAISIIALRRVYRFSRTA